MLMQMGCAKPIRKSQPHCHETSHVQLRDLYQLASNIHAWLIIILAARTRSAFVYECHY